MQSYWLTDRTNGEATLVDSDTVERLLGVEPGYVEWCIGEDGVFENEGWKARLAIGLADRSATGDDCYFKRETDFAF